MLDSCSCVWIWALSYCFRCVVLILVSVDRVVVFLLVTRLLYYVVYGRCYLCFFFVFKQKTAYEWRISDWSSDVCSSDLREAFSALRHPLLRRGAGEQQHQVGLERARGPDLLAVHDIVVAVAHRRSVQRQRVGAAGRLGHAEGLQAQLAGGDLRQVLALLLVRAVPQDGAHRVHLRVAGGTVAAGGVDLLQDGAAGRDRQAGAAILLGDQHGEEAGLRQRVDELGRLGALAVLLPPVFAGILRAQPADRLADLRIGLAELHGDRAGRRRGFCHGLHSAWCSGTGAGLSVGDGAWQPNGRGQRAWTGGRARRTIPHRNRSEEHTSELQS